MEKLNSVYIATSLDGHIADRNGELDWLNAISIPEGEDMGYFAFMDRIDALVMGRSTFETVCGFEVDWPYQKPVFVLSNSMKSIPKSHEGKAYVVSGPLKDVLEEIRQKGFERLYIDGGRTIQSFLKEDLIDELIITTMPVLIGGGPRLFAELPHEIRFELAESKVFVDQIVQNRYKRNREI